ncbi:uncharacterized protein LOC116616115 isoform X2 [Nematostella vectensis]|uniref:uncharacterized protein LOC116616115 isoform X2 n=1 Tax=Nematostella vectensis TaxID=45351 RepID=UPI001390094F|nr:uncharacterized protein LOC116616115 isoform X2 [Nematostella vectensis]
MVLLKTLLVLVLLQGLGHANGDWRCNRCNVKFRAIGCYKDKKHDRALSEQILNERDTSSNVYGNQLIDWHDWNDYLSGFACRCAKVARTKGYSFFSLQFYGECWSGPDVITSVKYNKHGESDKCITDDYQKCGKFSRFCVGEQWTNFVYEIVRPTCRVERVGCFKDHHYSGARPFPEYVQTDRDISIPIYTGTPIDWRNWDAYMPDEVCRCAKAIKAKGYRTFGIQFYGECWSGPDSEVQYWRDGKSDQCVNHCFKPCKGFDKFCAGKNHANFVYRLQEAPCEIKHKPEGCFAEKSDDRAFKTELLDRLDPASPHFYGSILDLEKWNEFSSFVCACARAAKFNNFNSFGIHNNATCWGGNAVAVHGKSDECVNDKGPCPDDKESDCAGGPNSIYAYTIYE